MHSSGSSSRRDGTPLPLGLGEEKRPSEGARRRRVLVVDADHRHRRAITEMLLPLYDVLEASDGVGAVEKALGGEVDAVIMAVQLDGISGYEAARQIEEGLGPGVLPILLIAGGDDEDDLAESLAGSGADLLTKPVRRPLLRSKLDAVLRFGDLFQQLKRQTNELGYFREHARRDYLVAERVFDSMLQRGCLFLPSVQYCAMPMERFNGDVVLAAPVASSQIRLLLGDFAGHGLAAAVGTLPISDIFYATAEKGLPIESVLREMNTKIFSTLPRNMFLSAVLLELDLAQGRCVAWNGGIPEAFVLRADGTVRRRIEPSKPPLGIYAPEEFDPTVECFAVETGERLFIYTDGVIEATDREGDFFGQERLERALAADPHAVFSTPAVNAALDGFRGGVPQRDDITFIEVVNERRLGSALRRLVGAAGGAPRRQRVVSVMMDVAALQQPEPLGPIQSLLELHAELREHRSIIYTVLAELFGNAVDHGLLRLDSAVKDEAGGFDRYYERRRRALDALLDGRVFVTVDIVESSEGRDVVVRVEDSGFGFSPKTTPMPAPDGEFPSPRGRGLLLVTGLCRRFEVLDSGRVVEATVSLAGPPESKITGTFDVVDLPPRRGG